MVYDQAGDSDLRRRAAWLLGLLAIVAVLIVVLILVLSHPSDGNKHQGAAPDDSLVASPTSSSAKKAPTTKAPTTTQHNTPRGNSRTSATTPPPATCRRLCVLDGDVGNAVAAINNYRAAHGQPRVSGSVSKAAQTCALTNGSTCSGGWAESQVAHPTGAAALQKIIPLGKLLDPRLKSFEVGWAYDPGVPQYYFAIVKHD